MTSDDVDTVEFHRGKKKIDENSLGVWKAAQFVWSIFLERRHVTESGTV